jgi:hypothetical protein
VQIYNFMHSVHAFKKMDDLPEMLPICVVPLVTAVILHCFKRSVKRHVKPFCLKVVKDEGDADKLSKRADAGGDLIYKGIFYTTSSILGYIIMKDTPILPKGLGGSGSVDAIFADMPY